MQTLDLNVASRPFRNNTLLWTGYVAAVLVLALFSAWSVQTYLEHSRLLADVRDKVVNFDSRTRELQTRAFRAQSSIERYDLSALRVQAEKANEVIDWKAFSWTRLFNVMAEIQPYYVRMTSIRPIFRADRRDEIDFAGDTDQRVVPVAIQGTAKDFTAIADLQDALLADPHIGRVEPDRLYKSENGEYVFELQFYYLPERLRAAREAASVADGEVPEAAATDKSAEAGPDEPGEVADEAAVADPVVTRPVVKVPPAQPAPAEAHLAARTEQPAAGADADGETAAPVETQADAAADTAADRSGAAKRPVRRTPPKAKTRRQGRSGGSQAP